MRASHCSFFVAAASLAVCTAGTASAAGTRSSVRITCDDNLAFVPPPGGAVEIGKILLKTDGVIESDQMRLIADALARLDSQVGGLQDDVAILTADNAALKADNVALKAGNAALKTRVDDLEAASAETGATLATLKAGYASLTSEVAALKQEKAALEAAAATAASDNSSTSALELKVDNLEDSLVALKTNQTALHSQIRDLKDASAVPISLDLSEPRSMAALLAGDYKNVLRLNSLVIAGDTSALDGMDLNTLLPSLVRVDNKILVEGSNMKKLVLSKLRYAGSVNIGGEVGNDVGFENSNLTLVDFPLLEWNGGIMGFKKCPELLEIRMLELTQVGASYMINPNDHFALRLLPKLHTLLMPKLRKVNGYFSIYGAMSLIAAPSLPDLATISHYALFREVGFAKMAFRASGVQLCAKVGNTKEAWYVTECSTGNDGGDCYQSNSEHGC